MTPIRPASARAHSSAASRALPTPASPIRPASARARSSAASRALPPRRQAQRARPYGFVGYAQYTTRLCLGQCAQSAGCVSILGQSSFDVIFIIDATRLMCYAYCK
jgi:hypothetical protein